MAGESFGNLRDHPGEPLDRPVTVVVVGAGARGGAYAELVASVATPARVVAVVEPRDEVRTAVARRHAIPSHRRLSDWRELVDRPRLADLAIIATQDHDHVGPAVALARLGYDLLIEKPLAPDEAGIAAIREAVAEAGVTAAVCHVLRYTPHTRAVRALLAEGAIGDLVSVQHLEPIGWYHFAHSFVRGNWRREDQASSLLLAKSCHDLDWLCDIIDRPIEQVVSFGNLTHFRREAAPNDAGQRCDTCEIEPDCPYSAVRLYHLGAQWASGSGDHEVPVAATDADLGRLAAEVDGRHGRQPDANVDLKHPDRHQVSPSTAAYFARIAVGGVDPTHELVEDALATGPYGRCVYDCDNDVVDHQVVALAFRGGVTVDFQLTAFTPLEGRRSRLFGTHGQVVSDGRWLEVTDFRSGTTRTLDTLPAASSTSADAGHGGGDAGLIEGVLQALWSGRPDTIRSDLGSSLVSHRIAFAAERSRRNGTVERVVPE
ncbi:MAG TPA: Gfo/Idh/MocA family oxidoreductase [Nitriliruptoraceae bacterium]|nr:Gfo/Idh/MocA family oxidoreductase [Nitriliruptoraceae bacterium]